MNTSALDEADAIRYLPPESLTREDICRYRDAVTLPDENPGTYRAEPPSESRPAAQELLDANNHLKRCLGATAVLYGPEKEKPRDRIDREAKARAMCNQCRLIDACLEVALGQKIDKQYGFQGGMTAMERRRLITQRRQQKPLN